MSLTIAKPKNNWVLVRLEQNDKIFLDNGVVLFMPPASQQNNSQENLAIRGEVIAVPPALDFVQGDRSKMMWRTEMELQVGDKVILKRPAVAMALGPDFPSFFTEGEQIYIYIKYQECVVAIRKKWDKIKFVDKNVYDSPKVSGYVLVDEMGMNPNIDKGWKPEPLQGSPDEEIIVLNGFCIVEPISIGYKTNLVVPESAKKISQKLGIVRFVGKPNQEYHKTRNAKMEDDTPIDEVFWVRKEGEEIKIDKCELEPGDMIQFKESTAIMLEPGITKTLLGKDVPLYRMQRINIKAKI